MKFNGFILSLIPMVMLSAMSINAHQSHEPSDLDLDDGASKNFIVVGDSDYCYLYLDAPECQEQDIYYSDGDRRLGYYHGGHYYMRRDGERDRDFAGRRGGGFRRGGRR